MDHIHNIIGQYRQRFLGIPSSCLQQRETNGSCLIDMVVLEVMLESANREVGRVSLWDLHFDFVDSREKDGALATFELKDPMLEVFGGGLQLGDLAEVLELKVSLDVLELVFQSVQADGILHFEKYYR